MSRVLSGVFAVCLLLISLFSNAQPVLLKTIPTCGDFNETFGCQNQKFFGAGNNLYFFSNDSLWKSDGTPAGTMFVKKIGESVDFYNIITNGPVFYFLSFEASGNNALWRSDGTAGNTVKMGSFQLVIPLIVYKSELYLSINDVAHGAELWKVSGTTLSLFKEINPGASSSLPYSPTISNNVLYFAADGGLGNDIWKTDGTSAGTVMAIDLPNVTPFGLTDINGTIYFSEVVHVFPPDNPDYDAYSLWKTNGTLAGTVKLHEFGEEEIIYDLFLLRGKLFFFLNRFNTIDDLWTSDGTVGGTQFVREIRGGIDGFIEDFKIVNDFLVYFTNEQTFVDGIWRSDGTPSGTIKLAETPSLSPRGGLVPVGDLLFYSEHYGPSDFGSVDNYQDFYQLFQSDLTIENTKSVRKIFGSGNFAGSNNMTAVNGKLYFTTFNDNFNAPASDKVQRLYVYDPLKPSTSTPFFTLVDADADKDIELIKNGDTITKYPDKNITIRFTPVGSVGSVQFKINDVVRRTDNLAPYALAGDINGNFSPWLDAKQGNYKLTATPFSQSNASGTAGTPTIINFYIKEFVAPRVPIVSAGPDVDVILPKDSVVLTGTATDSDGTIRATLWQTISGPNSPDISNIFAKQITVKGLIEGVYVFSFTAQDNDFNQVHDEVQVTVKKVAGLAVVSYSLINADTDTEIKVLSDGETIDLSTLPTQNLNIKVNLNGTASKVVTKFDNQSSKTENVAPYSFFGDNNGNYNGVTVAAGSHTLLATPFTTSNTAGTPLTITITVVTGSVNKLPVVNAGIDKTVVLPATTVTLSGSAFDPDGNITSVLWTKIQGANVTLTGATSATLQVSGLAEGTYVFRLTATDNKGAQGFDEATVTVVKAGQSVVSFTLINADTDQDIKTISNNETINVSQLATSHLNIRINTNPNVVGSVKFTYDASTRTENGAPYAVFGDNNGNYNVGVLSNGSHTLTATPFSSGNGGGTMGNALTIHFNVTNSSAKIAASAPITPVASIKMYPNPSPSQFNIEIVEPGEEWIIVEILDMRGKLVETLFEGNASSSGLNLMWDGSQQEGGMYICRIKSNEKVVNQKLYVVK